MPIGAASCIHGASTLPISAISAINRLGIDTSLELCLDVADVDSYSGSGQTWSDLSGNSYDFLRGTTSGSESTDPTFNGTAGNLLSSTYWSFDGGDRFTLGQSNPTWVNNIHKNNATVTFLVWLYPVTESGESVTYFTSLNTSGGPGTGFLFNRYGSASSFEDSIGFFAYNSDTFVGGDGSFHQGLLVTLNQWNLVGVSFDEAAGVGGILWHMNGSTVADTATAAFTGPSSGAASTTLRYGGASATIPSGERIAVACAWSRALTAAEMDAFFQATRQRFGI